MAAMIGADAFGAAHQHDHRFVVAQRDPCRLTPAHRVRHERQLVAVRIAADPKRRDITIQKSFELRFRTEGEGSHLRMQSVGPHDQIESLLPAVRERDERLGAVFRDRADRDVEMDRDSLTGAGERGRQIGPRHADETAALCLGTTASDPYALPRGRRDRPSATASFRNRVRATSR